MTKISIELPKYQLAMHFRLVRRRKPLLEEEPLIPSVQTVSKKYRSGTIIGKFARYLSDHKSVRKVLTANFAAFVIATSFLPSVKASQPTVQADETVIQTQTTLVTEKGIQLPVSYFKINQDFSFFHPGIDIGGPVGEPIKPVKSGLVIEAGYTRDGYGNTILIDHGNGLESRYAHLSKIEVKVGQEVDMNTEIGKLGITGHTTGPHLHLEIRQNGVAQNPLTLLPR